MEDYNPKTILVSTLEPGHRFYFCGRIFEIFDIVDNYKEDYRLILFEKLNDTAERGTMELKGPSDFTILLNKE